MWAENENPNAGRSLQSFSLGLNVVQKKKKKIKPSNNIPWDEAYLLLQLSLYL